MVSERLDKLARDFYYPVIGEVYMAKSSVDNLSLRGYNTRYTRAVIDNLKNCINAAIKKKVCKIRAREQSAHHCKADNSARIIHDI